MRIIPSDECARVYSYLGLERAFRNAGAGAGAGFAAGRLDPRTIPGCQLFCCGDTSRFPTAIVVPADPLVNGDFEGGAGPADWLALNGSISRVAGTRPGGAGTYCCALDYDGANAHGYAYQFALAPGNVYSIDGWVKSVGGGIPLVGDDAVYNRWTGVAGDWQQFSTVLYPNTSAFYLHCANLAAGITVTWDDIRVTCLNSSQYTDLSGNGNHLVQATAAKQPLVVASGTGHLLRGDGTADFMAANYAADQPRTRYLLAKPTVQASARVLIDGFAADTGALKHKAASTTTQANAGSAFDGPVLTDATWQIFRLTLNGAASSIAINGGAPTVGDAGAGDPEGLTLGAAGGGAAGWAVADYACVLDYSGVHDAATAARVERYLSRLKQRLAL